MSDNWYFQLFGDKFSPVSKRTGSPGRNRKTLCHRPDSQCRTRRNGNPPHAQIDYDRIAQIHLDSGVIPMSTRMEWNDGAKRSTPTPVVSPDDRASDEIRLDDFVISNEDEVTRQSVSLERFLNQHGGSASSKGDEAAEESQFELAEVLKDQQIDPWFLKIDGEETGPFSPIELQIKIRKGEIRRNDFLRKGTSGAWQRAERVEVFRFPTAKPKLASVTEEPSDSQTGLDQNPPSEVEQDLTSKIPSASTIVDDDYLANDEKAAALAAFFADHEFDDEADYEIEQALAEQAETAEEGNIELSDRARLEAGSLANAGTSAGRRKNVGAGLQLDFNYESLKEGPLRFLVPLTVVLACVLAFYYWNPFGSGGKQLTELEQLWTEVQTKRTDPDFKSAATKIYLPKAEELFEELKPIPNIKSKVVAHVKVAVRDGLIPYLKRYPEGQEVGEETIQFHLDEARKSYDSGNF
ncbi:MAG: DUF4339 domain-containing protein [Planctomycetaceae bacterium]